MVDLSVSTDVDSVPRYEPYGWQHWPQQPILSYQFRRGLGETQEGGGAVSECFSAASRMIPGDLESWHAEWMRVGNRNCDRARRAEQAGAVVTARNCWLRAAGYLRQAEFFLEPSDPRRMSTFDQIEECSSHMLALLDPPGEIVSISQGNGIAPLPGYFVKPRSRSGADRKVPALISMGGLDSFKDELWFMQGRGAVARGIAVLMIDGPGQGASLRRHGMTTRVDYEKPVGACIDYLLTREDVDPERIAVCGSSLGGLYAARAASFDHRLAACISHGLAWLTGNALARLAPLVQLHMHFNWVFGTQSIEETAKIFSEMELRGIVDQMQCPWLIINGAHDVLGREDCTAAFEFAMAKGVDVTLRLTEPDETGADHCQHDNPTLGQELMMDWLADQLGINQRSPA